jgi:hypothetical protein
MESNICDGYQCQLIVPVNHINEESGDSVVLYLYGINNLLVENPLALT